MATRTFALDDHALLRGILDADRLPEELESIFTDMKDRMSRSGSTLTDAQRAFAEDVAKRFDVPDKSANMVSRGKVPDPGARFAPLDLLPRPLKPPGRA